MKRQLLIVLALLATCALVGCSGDTDSGAGGAGEGFDSPQDVFAHMKASGSSGADLDLSVVAPDERARIAYMQIAMMRFFAAASAEEKPEMARDFEAIIQKHDLAEKLEFTDNHERLFELATQAFAEVDLKAFMADVRAFPEKYELGRAEEKAEYVEMKYLEIEGNQATGTVVDSEGYEQQTEFVRVDGRWYVSLGQFFKDPGDDTGLAVGSMQMTFQITFDNQRNLQAVDMKTLLENVPYDRSRDVTLVKHHESLQASLIFWVPVTRWQHARDAIKRLPGVRDVKMDSSDATTTVSLRITFSDQQQFQAADEKTLLDDVKYDRSSEVTFVKDDTSQRASLRFWISVAEDIDDLFADIERVPGVQNVDWGEPIQQSIASGPEDAPPPEGREVAADKAPTAPASKNPFAKNPTGAKDPFNKAPTAPPIKNPFDKTSDPPPAKLSDPFANRPPATAFKPSPRALPDLSKLTTRGFEPDGWGLAFDGRGTRVTAPHIPFDDYKTFTIEAWVRGFKRVILSQGPSGDPENSIWLALGARDSSHLETCGWEAGSGTNYMMAVGTVDPVAWNHIALVYDGRQQNVFVNGKLTRSRLAPRPGPFDKTRSLLIGAFPTLEGDQSASHLGLLGPVRISKAVRYREAFTPSWELSTDADTVLLYELTEGKATRIRDSSGNKLDGIITAARWRKAQEIFSLDLGGTQLTDAGLEPLKTLKGLEILSLQRTSITDAGLTHLMGMTGLRSLDLSVNSKVTDAGIARLQKALPNCRIHR